MFVHQDNASCRLHKLPIDYFVIHTDSQEITKLGCNKCLSQIKPDHTVRSIIDVRNEIARLKQQCHPDTCYDKMNIVLHELYSKLEELTQTITKNTSCLKRKQGIEIYKREVQLLERDLLTDPNLLVSLRELNERRQAVHDREKAQHDDLMLREIYPYLCGAVNLINHSISPENNLPTRFLTRLESTSKQSSISELKLSLVLKQQIEEQQAELVNLRNHKTELVSLKLALQQERDAIKLTKLNEQSTKHQQLYVTKYRDKIKELQDQIIGFEKENKRLQNHINMYEERCTKLERQINEKDSELAREKGVYEKQIRMLAQQNTEYMPANNKLKRMMSRQDEDGMAEQEFKPLVGKLENRRHPSAPRRIQTATEHKIEPKNDPTHNTVPQTKAAGILEPPEVFQLETLFDNSKCFDKTNRFLPNVIGLIKILNNQWGVAGSRFGRWEKGNKQVTLCEGWDQLSSTLILIRAKQNVFGGLMQGSLVKNNEGIVFFIKQNIEFHSKKMASATLTRQLSIEFGDRALTASIPSGRGSFDFAKLRTSFTSSCQNTETLSKILSGAKQFEIEALEIYSVIVAP